ncbi:predicted protein [Botrytis cinerea T4]|uniref:Uncharacterized protein n=1 Tax=Botryotinia fuckeliana (strain T4) TaxID=999810 RepID=G2XNK4_BOTF4|nr:predicted protein [Botrytis cinerea T4]
MVHGEKIDNDGNGDNGDNDDNNKKGQRQYVNTKPPSHVTVANLYTDYREHIHIRVQTLLTVTINLCLGHYFSLPCEFTELKLEALDRKPFPQSEPSTLILHDRPEFLLLSSIQLCPISRTLHTLRIAEMRSCPGCFLLPEEQVVVKDKQ